MNTISKMVSALSAVALLSVTVTGCGPKKPAKPPVKQTVPKGPKDCHSGNVVAKSGETKVIDTGNGQHEMMCLDGHWDIPLAPLSKDAPN